MSKKIKIQKVSSWSIRITIVVAILFVCISIINQKEFSIVRQTTEQYIDCEKAQQSLKKYFDGTDTFNALKKALNYSTELMDTEYYSMRLVSEATGQDKDTWSEQIQKVATLLRTTFCSIDYPCRIGGDEFALIMVEMTSDLKYTIEEKIDYMNEILSNLTDNLPVISLSVGVAFADRENPRESIFKDADKALYYVKEHGRHGYSFY